MESQEMKQKIKDLFVEINEDKFTKVKTINCKHNITWKGKDLENKFMLTENSYSNELKMEIDYRHKDEVDSVFFTFNYTNSDSGYPGMTNIKMYLIIDDDKNIELSESSGFDHSSRSSKVGDNYINLYFETAQLAVSMSDYISIANAKKIEYSIRFGKGSLEKIFSQNDLMIFKGFYNASFDNDFELNTLQNNKYFKLILLINSVPNTVKSIIGKYDIVYDDIIKMIFTTKGKSNYDTEMLSQFDTISKKYRLSKYENFQLMDYFRNYDSRYILGEQTSNKPENTIENKNSNFKANELSKDESKSLIRKYNVNGSDLKRLRNLEKEKTSLGFFSLRKERIKAESMQILKPYKVQSMDLGALLEEIKKLNS